MTIRILNLYAGIGGNRKFWGGDIEVTAVEIDPQIAKIYQDFFPQDRVVVGDAHQYLLEHYKEFDFIWSSPPCPTHTRFNFLKMEQQDKGFKPKYPDMALWQEIIFLQTWFEGKWVVENVKIYYDFETTTKHQESGNHYYWCNFLIIPQKKGMRSIRRNSKNAFTLEENEKNRGFVLPDNIPKTLKEKILNNCVLPQQGKYIFDCAFIQPQKTLF